MTPLTPDGMVATFAKVGMDTQEAFDTFVAASVKPVQRAAVQAQIDAENKAFAATLAAHNQTQLNTI